MMDQNELILIESEHFGAIYQNQELFLTYMWFVCNKKTKITRAFIQDYS